MHYFPISFDLLNEYLHFWSQAMIATPACLGVRTKNLALSLNNNNNNILLLSKAMFQTYWRTAIRWGWSENLLGTLPLDQLEFESHNLQITSNQFQEFRFHEMLNLKLVVQSNEEKTTFPFTRQLKEILTPLLFDRED